MTFEDGIAYSRNVVAAKVALGLGDTTDESSAMLYDTWRKLGFGAKTGIDVAGEVARPRARPGDHAVGARSTSRTARSARASRSRRSSSRRRTPRWSTAARSSSRTSSRRSATRDVERERRAAGSSTQARLEARCSRMMNHVVTEVPFYRDRTLVPGYHVGGKTGTAQIWDAKATEGRWKDNLFNYSFVGYIGREAGAPDLVVAVRIEEGTPTRRPRRPARDAGHVVRAVPADRDRRDHDARTCSTDRPSPSPCPSRTGDGGPMRHWPP